MCRAIAVLLLALLPAVGGGAPAPATGTPAAGVARSWHIEEFRSDVQVLTTGDVVVTERIRVRFEGSYNGIYRDIPVEYRTRLNLNYTLQLVDVSVQDGEGGDLQFESSRNRHYRRIKVWVPNARDAARTVVIRYTVRNAIKWFDEDDREWTEFYWNVTGDEWPVRIERSSARIVLPSAATGVRARVFTGSYGSTESEADLDIAGSVIEAGANRSLGIKEGLSVTVAWDTRVGGQPDGAFVVRPPSTARLVARWFRSNWPFGIPILVFFGMYRMWSRIGRDPPRHPVAPRYEPPDGLTPAEAGALIDGRLDMRDVTSMIVDLAVRGFLTIQQEPGTRILGFSVTSDSFVFELLRDRAGWSDLKRHEVQLLDAMFGGRTGDTTSTSDLKNSFYKNLPGIRDALWDALKSRGYYRARPDRVQQGWLIGAAAIGGITVFLGVVVAEGLGMSLVTTVAAGILSAIIVAAFGSVMPARTVEGARAQEQALGFEDFLGRVESDRFKRMIKTPEMFEQYLPFAMAFGVEDTWAQAFADIYQDRQPTWYTGHGGMRFHAGSLAGDLSRMATTTASAMASAPRSSGGSGFGGGGGGGFSGGGFGGGGGGAF
ncbi:MAG: DUF2207 domain-containing protein [Gemmatimonadota bacterium]|nr:DUF2207 domain-containing protein [Gemmatimonadota bacterium]